MRWVRQQIGSFLEVLHSPETAFQNEFSGPSYLVPCASSAFWASALRSCNPQSKWNGCASSLRQPARRVSS